MICTSTYSSWFFKITVFNVNFSQNQTLTFGNPVVQVVSYLKYASCGDGHWVYAKVGGCNTLLILLGFTTKYRNLSDTWYPIDSIIYLIIVFCGPWCINNTLNSSF